MATDIGRVLNLDAAWDELLPLLTARLEYHAPILGLPLLPNWAEKQRERMSAHGEMLARHGDDVVAFLDGRLIENPFWFEERCGYIENAFVRSELREGGVGRAFLDAEEGWSLGLGVDQLQLTVLAANELGVTVWRQTGFAPRSIRMVKNLRGGSRD